MQHQVKLLVEAGPDTSFHSCCGWDKRIAWWKAHLISGEEMLWESKILPPVGQAPEFMLSFSSAEYLYYLARFYLQTLDLHKDCKSWSSTASSPPSPKLQGIQFVSCNLWILISTVWQSIYISLLSHSPCSCFPVLWYPATDLAVHISLLCFQSTTWARWSTGWLWASHRQTQSSNASHFDTFPLEGRLIQLSVICYSSFLKLRYIWSEGLKADMGVKVGRQTAWSDVISFRNQVKYLKRKRKKEHKAGSERCNRASFSLSFTSLGILLIGLNRNWTLSHPSVFQVNTFKLGDGYWGSNLKRTKRRHY